MANNSRIIILGTVSEIAALGNNRTSAGLILDVDGIQIVLDPGIGTVVKASQSNVDLARTNIILTSTLESAYVNDINAVVEHTKDAHLICPREMLKHDENILTVHHARNLEIIPLEKDEERHKNIKGIDIYAYYNKSDALSFKIISSKYVLGYITKARYSKTFVDSFKDSNILIMNLYTLRHDKNSRYLDMEEITELIREINPELVILNGFSKKIIESDPLDIARKIKQELQKDKEMPIKTQILPAKESMILNPEAYNIRLKQKNLKGFFS